MKYLYCKSKEIYRKEALKVAIAFGIGLFLLHVFNIQEGTWMLLTLSVIYLGGAAHAFTMQRISKILLGVLLGLIFGMFFLVLISFNNYLFLYLSPIFFFLAFYSYFISKTDYFYLSFFLSFYLFIIVAIQTPSYTDLNVANTIFGRFFCTLLATLIMVVVHITFFRKSTLPKYTTVPLLREVFDSCINSLESVNRNFLAGRYIKSFNLHRIIDLFSETISIKTLAEVVEYELNFVEGYEVLYRKIDYHLNRFTTSMEKLTYISNHYESHKISNPELIKKVIKQVDLLKTGNLSHNNLSKMMLKIYFEDSLRLDRRSPDFLYLKELHYALWNLVRISVNINNINK